MPLRSLARDEGLAGEEARDEGLAGRRTSTGRGGLGLGGSAAVLEVQSVFTQPGMTHPGDCSFIYRR